MRRCFPLLPALAVAAALWPAPIRAAGIPVADPGMPGPKRVREIEDAAYRWRSFKAKAERMRDEFLGNAKREFGGDYPQVEKVVRDAWALVLQSESLESRRFDALYRRLDEAVESGLIDPVAMARERALLDKIFRLRMLAVSGDMFPRVLDEFERDASDRPIGRRHAPVEWAIAVTETEWLALGPHYTARLSWFHDSDLNGPVP